MKVRYSRAVRLSNRARSSGMTPMRRLASSDSRGSSMFLPRTRISPLRRRQQAGQHLDGGRFAGAVGPEEAVKGAALDAQIDAVDGAEVVEEARELMGFDRQAHEGRSPRGRCDVGPAGILFVLGGKDIRESGRGRKWPLLSPSFP